jgi:hypothetical protein
MYHSGDEAAVDLRTLKTVTSPPREKIAGAQMLVNQKLQVLLVP